ncbi:MAG: gamma-glutamylcyclotransferase [Alphaproteobacteria bacterium]|nr:gamma-glutamylcyclotransferase [Alphaproteobacteria bacterium]
MSFDFVNDARQEREKGLDAHGHPALSEEESEARKRAFLDSLPPKEDVWFFGYGSLMWDPGFDYLERAAAALPGYSRSFCVASHRYRGTPETPGLVLGLDRTGNVEDRCHGVAYRVCGVSGLAAVVEYLWAREMVTGVYDPTSIEAHLDDGRRVTCCAFVVNAHHPQYLGHAPEDDRAAMIARAEGRRGPNRDYLENTLAQLERMGLSDPDLARIGDKVRRRAEAEPPCALAPSNRAR